MQGQPSDPAELAEAIRAAADLAQSELDLQIKVEKLLDPFLPKIPGAPEHYGHATKLGGIEDALHGNVIIEYERPGKLSKPAGLDECLQQLRDYLTQEAHRHGRQATAALKRMVGIGLDGREIVFVRYRGKDAAPYLPPAKVSPQLAFFPEPEVRDFYRDGPHPVTAESVETLLACLNSLARPLAAAEDRPWFWFHTRGGANAGPWRSRWFSTKTLKKILDT